MTGDLTFFERFAAVPVGEEIVLTDEQEDNEQLWNNLGFLQTGARSYRRVADLTGELVDLVTTDSNRLSAIDCVAVVSVDRGGDDEPYLYQTLRSLFAAFPEDVQVNVLVGNANADYVTGDRLAAAVGVDHARRVHPWPTSTMTANYLANHLHPSRRGGWNTVRGLRSYRGGRGLLLMEDDILFTRGAIVPFDQVAAAEPLAAFSLYNYHCHRMAPSSPTTAGMVRGDGPVVSSLLEMSAVDTRQHDFYGMQAVLYAPDLPGPLGRYTLRRMHVEHHDNVVGMFFRENHALVGYPFPSIVQHVGFRSAYGSNVFHQSSCFREEL